MFRGEPFVTLLIAVMVYFLIQLYQEEYELNFLNSLLFGALIGLIALSRQWGFFRFFYGCFFLHLFLEKNFHLKDFFGFFTISSIVGFIISGWFYLGLYNQYGSFAKFNLEPNNFSMLDLIEICI